MSESGYLNSRQAQKKNVSKKLRTCHKLFEKKTFCIHCASRWKKSFGSHGSDGRIMSQNVT